MKLVRFGPAGKEKPGLLDAAGQLRDLNRLLPDMLPGDVITTGTPPGVGLGMKPPKFLKEGDIMSLGIDGLGAQQQLVVPFKR